jgi:hypothetical protein
MKSLQINTATTKGLTTLNILSIVACIILYILIPVLNVFAEVISSRPIYIISIIMVILNCFFYLAPVGLRGIYFQRRIFIIYLPCLVIIGLAIWVTIDVIINIKLQLFLTIAFSVICAFQPISFALLVSKLIQE